MARQSRQTKKKKKYTLDRSRSKRLSSIAIDKDSSSSSSNSDDDDDDDIVVEPAVKMSNRRRRRYSNGNSSSSSSSFHKPSSSSEGDNDDDDDDKLVLSQLKGRNKKPKQQSTSSSRKKKKTAVAAADGSSSDDDYERKESSSSSSDDDDDDDEDYDNNDESMNDDDDEEEEEAGQFYMPMITPKKKKKKKIASDDEEYVASEQENNDDDDDDNESDDDFVQESEDDEKEQRNSKAVNIDNEKIGSAEESSSSSSSSSSNDDDDDDDDDNDDKEKQQRHEEDDKEEEEEVQKKRKRIRQRMSQRKKSAVVVAVNIDNEQIGSIEESSSSSDDDDDNGDKRRKRTSRGEEILPSQGYLSDSDDYDNNYDSRVGKERPKCPTCPSIKDEITLERLPPKHICFISPDGSSRQCFALETLRMIALKSSSFFNTRVNLDGSSRQSFLQPPHFRSPMSDDMLDQIASKFGREALDINGEYYKRRKRNLSTGSGRHDTLLSDHDGEDEDLFVDYSNNEETFRGRVEAYIEKQMRGKDIYACPLCYTKIHKRMVKAEVFKPKHRRKNRESNDDDDEEEEEDSEGDDDKSLPGDSVYDPMLVLDYLGSDFEIASFFCFKRVANLKKHLRDDHFVDTKKIQGNELYKRFQVRSSDGLLQRWLNGDHRRFAPSQGSMLTYWLLGNRESFLHLFHQMNKAEQYRDLLESANDETEKEMAENYMAKAHEYFDSFQDHVKEAWEHLSMPFQKGGDDMEDFLAYDDESESEGEAVQTPHFAMRQQIEMNDDDSAGNAFVHEMEKKYLGSQSSVDESSLAGKSEEDNEEEEEEEEEDGKSDVYNMNGYYSDVQEETDPWMLNKLSARKKKGGGRKSEAHISSPATNVKKKIVKKAQTPSPRQNAMTNHTSRTTASSSSSKKKRLVVEESSSSSSSSSSDEELEII